MEFYDKSLKYELISGSEKYLYDSYGNCLHRARCWEKGKNICRICGKDMTPKMPILEKSKENHEQP